MQYCQEDFSDFCSCSLVWFKYNISISWPAVTPPNTAAAGRSRSARCRRWSQTPGAPPPAKWRRLRALIKATCQEVAAAGLGPMSTCIIQHPGFSSVSLDVWVLQAVYNEYKQRYGHSEKSLFELVLSWLLIIAVKLVIIELFSYYLTCSMLNWIHKCQCGYLLRFPNCISCIWSYAWCLCCVQSIPLLCILKTREAEQSKKWQAVC